MAAVTLATHPPAKRVDGQILGYTPCVFSIVPDDLHDRRGVPVFWEPQSGRKQSLTTPTSLYNG
ncbi:hypothetical protein, partial [Rathayibacter agropyri]|uniref:hypothetical protein n=1 Tax=Rathayibacter agropyri TaxID=1634927 RepID=UPI001CA3A103